LLKPEKKKLWKTFLHNSQSKRSFRRGIHSLLRRADAREALTSFSVSDAYR